MIQLSVTQWGHKKITHFSEDHANKSCNYRTNYSCKPQIICTIKAALNLEVKEESSPLRDIEQSRLKLASVLLETRGATSDKRTPTC